MKTVLVTAPASLPVSLAEAKTQCVVDTTFTEDDTFLTGLIGVALEYVEQHTGVKLITQTHKLLMDSWPAGDTITVPFGKCTAVSSIKYKDEDSTETTMDTDLYIVDTDSVPARIVLVKDESWPDDELLNVNPITVEFITGYGLAAAVPQPIKHAIKLLIGHWYLNREAVYVGQLPRVLQLSVERLLSPFRKDGGLI